jgi:sigma-B regulation protein RsbU (phosphoserine phosphatase)
MNSTSSHAGTADSAPADHLLNPPWRPHAPEAAAGALPADYVNDLLAEIDSALERIDGGTYGICEVCHDTIEADRLEQDPLVRFCLDHLSGEQRKAHEQDLELATRIQARLLPPKEVALAGWETHYRYEPAGAVGGDYCELMPAGDGASLFFAVGDVAGKGVAASLLMTHLNAIFRSLLLLELPLAEVVARANRLFCESTAASHYATLACGRTTADGVELCNAGHCRPLVLRGGAAERIDATGLPLGLFPGGRYTTRHVPLACGDCLVLYSDGITEAQDPQDNDYEEDRLIRALCAHPGGDVRTLAGAVVGDVVRFRATRPQHDDITLLIVRRR